MDVEKLNIEKTGMFFLESDECAVSLKASVAEAPRDSAVRCSAAGAPRQMVGGHRWSTGQPVDRTLCHCAPQHAPPSITSSHVLL